VWDSPTAFVVRVRWRPLGQELDGEMFQVLRVEDGKIREIADYRALPSAIRTAKRFANV